MRSESHLKRAQRKHSRLRCGCNLILNAALMKILLSLLLLVGVVTTGCLSPGRKLNPAAVSQIQEGKTTRAEIEKMFGPPVSVFKSSEQKTLTLHKRQQNRHNPDWRGPVTSHAGAIVLFGLSVLYDANQTVEKFHFSQSITPVQRDHEGVFPVGRPPNRTFQKLSKESLLEAN